MHLSKLLKWIFSCSHSALYKLSAFIVRETQVNFLRTITFIICTALPREIQAQCGYIRTIYLTFSLERQRKQNHSALLLRKDRASPKTLRIPSGCNLSHSSVLAWRIPGTGEPGGRPSLGSHRVRHDWSDLTAAAAIFPSLLALRQNTFISNGSILSPSGQSAKQVEAFALLLAWKPEFWQPGI